MAWIKVTIHWIVSDCDLGEVSVYTPSEGCVGIRVIRTVHRCQRTRCEHTSWIIRVED